MATRTLPVHKIDDVTMTANVIIPTQTSSYLHSPIEGACHEDHLIFWTGGVEIFPTIFYANYKRNVRISVVVAVINVVIVVVVII